MPPCTGDVTSTITVSASEHSGDIYFFTATGTIQNERSDPIGNVSVRYSYGLPASLNAGSPAMKGDVSSTAPIPPGGTAEFSSSGVFAPIYVTPVEPSATVTSVTYADTSSGPGC